MSTEPVGVSGDRVKKTILWTWIAATAIVVGRALGGSIKWALSRVWAGVSYFSPTNVRDEDDRDIASMIFGSLSAFAMLMHSLALKFEFLDTPNVVIADPSPGSLLTVWNLGFLTLFIWTLGPTIVQKSGAAIRSVLSSMAAAIKAERERIESKR